MQTLRPPSKPRGLERVLNSRVHSGRTGGQRPRNAPHRTAGTRNAATLGALISPCCARTYFFLLGVIYIFRNTVNRLLTGPASGPILFTVKGVQGLYPDPFVRGNSSLFYFVYIDPKAGKRRQKSTGTSIEREARKLIKRFMDALAEESETQVRVSFAEYSRPFFLDGQCPRRARKRDEGRPLGLRNMSDMRDGLERVVGRDASGQRANRRRLPFADILMSKVTRADLLELRGTLRKNPGGRVGQTAFKAVKLVFAEAYERGDLSPNPAVDVPNYKRPQSREGAQRERDAFTVEELRTLYHYRFGITYLGRSSEGFKGEIDTRPVIALVLAMGLGVRQAELRALRWENVDLEAGTISIVDYRRGTLSDTVSTPTR